MNRDDLWLVCHMPAVGLEPKFSGTPHTPADHLAIASGKRNFLQEKNSQLSNVSINERVYDKSRNRFGFSLVKCTNVLIVKYWRAQVPFES